ncbi:MAG: hypothetical protein OHK0015_54230 [Chloroflexi bacterium OHK40]
MGRWSALLEYIAEVSARAPEGRGIRAPGSLGDNTAAWACCMQAITGQREESSSADAMGSFG